MSIDDLRGIVRRVGGDAGPLELAEILWLAHHLPGPTESSPAGPAGGGAAVVGSADYETPTAAAPVGEAPPQPGEPTQAPPPAAAHAAPPREQVPLHLATPLAPASVEEAVTTYSGGATVKVPEAPGIGDRLNYTRSLRPLKRAVPTGPPNILDEAATADHIADSIANHAPWQPVFRPAMRRWMSAVVVIERSDSMRLWSGVIAALPGLLAETGAFSDVHTWYLEAGLDGTPTVRPARAGSPRPPGELIDPSGRRAVVLVTDCVGPIWTSGQHRDLLRKWGRHAHVGIFQPFPERLWSRTHAPTSLVRLTSPRPGAPNAEFTVRMLDGMPDPDPGTIAVPVMQIAPAWWRRWARFAASGVGTRAAATLIPARDPDPDDDFDDPGWVEPPNDTGELVRRFRAVASPPAVRLAGYLAMSKPYLPVMRHVHRAMLSPVREHHLAEVLLSGLMRPVEARHGVYTFVDESVQEQLLLGVSRSESYLLKRVSDQIDDLIDRTPGGFSAVLGGTGALRITGLESPFAILSRQGVERLHGGNGTEPPPTPEPDPVPVPAERITRLLDQPVVRLLGREDELAELTAWCANGPAEPALLLGPGGAGKTRLAMELADRQREAGWAVEFVSPDEPLPEPSSGPRMLIVDAADTRTDDFVAHAGELAGKPSYAIVFTARSEDDWWRRRLPVSTSTAELRLSSLELDEATVGATVSELVHALATNVSDLVDWGAVSLPELPDRLHPGELVATVLLAMLDANHATAAAELVVDHLVGHERAYWIRTAVRHRVSAPAPWQLADLIAAATMFGADTAAEARSLAARMTGRLKPDDVSNRVAAWMHAVLPGDHLSAIRPSAVADRIVATAVIRQPDLVQRGLAAGSPAQCRRAIAVLGRAAATYPGLAPVIRDAIAGHPELLRWAAASVPGLPPTGQAVLVEAIGTALAGPSFPPELIRDVLTALPDHERLFDGRPVGSVEALVGHYRRLVIFSRQYEPLLADALRRLWQAQHDAGRADEALATTREEVETYARLVRAEPDRYPVRQADALLRHADQLARNGNDAEAARVSGGAVTAFDSLTRGGETAHLPAQAEALLRRADVLDRLGRRPEAVDAITTAVGIYRRLPDRRADLALALLRQATGRGALGDHLGAVRPAGDSVDIYRGLAAGDRHRYRPALAHALFVCALEHGDLGVTYAARAHATEAVAIYRQLAGSEPAYRDRLSASWHLLAAQHYELGSYGECREALAAAVAALPTAGPGPLPRQVRAADLYRTYALELGRAERPAAAETAMREAVTRYAALARADDAYAPLHADALSRRADWLGQLGREHEATDCLTEAVAIYVGQLDSTPSLRPNILDCYRRLSALWEALGDHARARRYAAEAAKP